MIINEIYLQKVINSSNPHYITPKFTYKHSNNTPKKHHKTDKPNLKSHLPNLNLQTPLNQATNPHPQSNYI